MSADQFRDAVGAYLIGALDEDELAGFEAHLQTCRECRQELESLRVAADALPASVHQLAPPPELKDRIMSVVRSEAELLQAAGPRADRPEPARARRSWWGWLTQNPALAGAAAAAVLVVGVLGGLVVGGVTGPETQTVAAQVDSPGASARLEMRGDRAELVAANLPDPGPGRVYQVWIKRPGSGPKPTAALFTTDHAGGAEVGVPGSMEGVEAVLVTSEPAGGSTAPTRAPIIAVETA